jgi:hypothetical protein
VFPVRYELNSYTHYLEEIGLLPKSLCATEKSPTGHFDTGFLCSPLS